MTYCIKISGNELSEIGFALLMEWANTANGKRKESIESLMQKLAKVAYRPLQSSSHPLEDEEADEK